MFRIGLLTLALSAAALAQTVPGTFITNPANAATNLPLVSTPTLTLSNGFTPATISMSPTVVAEEPLALGTSALPQFEGAEMRSDALLTANNSSENVTARPDFDFPGAGSSSAFDFGFSGPSLAEVARQLNRGKVQAHKTYSNQDIEQLTSEVPQNGIIYAKLSNGEPITDRNQNGFSPMSGIANMPDVTARAEGTELANNPADRNPMSEGQTNATASNADQGQPNGQSPTTPAMNTQPTGSDAGNQQLPAGDTPR